MLFCLFVLDVYLGDQYQHCFWLCSLSRYAIRAHNAAGWGPMSDTVTLRTLPDVPGVPTALRPTGNTATAVRVSCSCCENGFVVKHGLVVKMVLL